MIRIIQYTQKLSSIFSFFSTIFWVVSVTDHMSQKLSICKKPFSCSDFEDLAHTMHWDQLANCSIAQTKYSKNQTLIFWLQFLWGFIFLKMTFWTNKSLRWTLTGIRHKKTNGFEYLQVSRKKYKLRELNTYFSTINTRCVLENTWNVQENTRKVLENTRNVQENTRKVLENTRKVLENTKNVLENTRNVLENTRNVLENTTNVLENTRNVLENTRNVLENHSNRQEKTRNVLENSRYVLENTRNALQSTRNVLKMY